MSTSVRRTKGKEREERIVAAAAEVIAERGLAYTRISDVADRAGITPGHVTYYFPSKNELLMRAIGANEESLVDDMNATLGRIRDPWKRLDKLVELSAASGPGDPGWVLWFQVWLEGALDASVARGHDELQRRWTDVLEQVLRYGVEQGAFRDVDVTDAATVLSATIDGLSIQLSGSVHAKRRGRARSTSFGPPHGLSSRVSTDGTNGTGG